MEGRGYEHTRVLFLDWFSKGGRGHILMAGAVAVSDAQQLLDRGVSLLIGGWHVLQVAVDNSLGGPQSKEKAEWMVEVTTQYLTNNGKPITTHLAGCVTVCYVITAGVHAYDIEDFLDAILDQEFNTLVEDGSLSEVSITMS